MHQHPKKKFVGIGINYFGTSAELGGCHKDIDDISEYFVEKGWVPHAILKDSESDPHHQLTTAPTAAHIEAAITSLIDELEPGDYGYIHYSGHGSHVDDQNGDEADGQDECLCPVDYSTAGFIIDDQLNQWIVQASRVGVILRIVFDCCHSGTALDMPILWKSGTLFSIENKSEPIAKNILFLSACKDSQTASDATFGGRPNGALTWAMLQNLKNMSEGYHWKEFCENIRRSIKRKGFDQIPSLGMMVKSQINTKVDL